MTVKLVVVAVMLSFSCTARGGEADSTGPGMSGNAGLFIDAGTTFHAGSSAGGNRGGYAAMLGVGYCVSERLSFAAEVFTGDEDLSRADGRPLWGRMALGGAGIQSRFLVTGGGRVRPDLTLGFMLFTVMDDHGDGYNGIGPYAGGGIDWCVSRYISMGIDAMYGLLRIANPVGNADPKGVLRPFQDHIMGGTLHVSFYPGVRP